MFAKEAPQAGQSVPIPLTTKVFSKLVILCLISTILLFGGFMVLGIGMIDMLTEAEARPVTLEFIGGISLIITGCAGFFAAYLINFRSIKT